MRDFFETAGAIVLVVVLVVFGIWVLVGGFAQHDGYFVKQSLDTIRTDADGCSMYRPIWCVNERRKYDSDRYVTRFFTYEAAAVECDRLNGK